MAFICQPKCDVVLYKQVTFRRFDREWALLQCLFASGRCTCWGYGRWLGEVDFVAVAGQGVDQGSSAADAGFPSQDRDVARNRV